MLHPDTLFFLGDLFDGGREWKTAHGNTQDQSWANGQRPSGEQAYVETWGKRYGEDFWLKEYDRFGRIFYKYWGLGGDEAGAWQRGRRIISSLPGNHDLGFGENIKIPIRDRFEVYFGEGNRVDIIGNHTFVSVDSVSLSAGGSIHDTAEITKPVEDFLSKVDVKKRKAVARELSLLAGEEKVLQHKHGVEELDKVDFKHLPTLDPELKGSADFPTILLTHVPLYRNPGEPCGPKREHWPPTPPPKGQTTPVNPDDRNAISISKGYQYQNVLSQDDSRRLVSTIGNVVSVFSGDDHDYCEVIHEDKNMAREITVKSMSWAMGVRRPGFLMLSMWNPVDPSGFPLHSTPTGHGTISKPPPTTESHLCLLPDQISIFIRYGIFLAITLFVLITRAILMPIFNLVPFSSPPSDPSDDQSLLPTTTKDLKRREDTEPDRHRASSSASSNNLTNLAPRTTTARTRSVSPANGYGLPASQTRNTPPLIASAGYYPPPNHPNGYYNSNSYGYQDDEFEKGKSVAYETMKRKPDTVLMKVCREVSQSIWRTAWMVLLVYLYLVYYG